LRVPPSDVPSSRSPPIIERHFWKGSSTAQTILIAGLVLERRRRRQAERLLEQRLEFETLVSELSSHLRMVDRTERPPLIMRWLQRLANSLDVDRANLLPATNGHAPPAPLALAATTAWGRASAYPATDFTALTEFVQRGEVVRFDSLEVPRPRWRRTGKHFVATASSRSCSCRCVTMVRCSARSRWVGHPGGGRPSWSSSNSSGQLADALNGHDRAGSNGNHHPSRRRRRRSPLSRRLRGSRACALGGLRYRSPTS
jgi:hypothetical protein